MASTYELIASQTLGSNTATVTFSSIPGTYDDLVILSSARTDRATTNVDHIILEFNGSTSGYSMRYLEGSGSGVSSGSLSECWAGQATATSNTANTFGNSEAYIPNYAGSTYKSVSITGLSESNATSAFIHADACLWSNTAAITSFELSPRTGTNFVTGSSFYLYGVTHA